MVIASFVMTIYILLFMYYSLEKEPLGADFLEFIGVLVPFVCVLGIYCVNAIFGHKAVNENIFYNITAVIIFSTIVFMIVRALTDQNLILWHKTSYHINFDYFGDQIFQIKAMLIGLFITDVLLIVEGKLSKKKELEIMD